MSIARILAEQTVSPWFAAALGLATLISASLAVRLRGALRPAAAGQRIAPGERPEALLWILLAGVTTWGVLGPSVYASVVQPAAATRGVVQFTDAQQVRASALSGFSAIVVLLLGNVVLRRGGLRRMGLGPEALPRSLLPGIVGILIIMPPLIWATLGVEMLFRALGISHPAKHAMLQVLDQTEDIGLASLLIVTALVIAPVFEELLFRGHLQSLLLYALGRRWLAIVLPSALFAAVHPWWTQAPIFLLAVCLGWAYEHRGNLWTPIVMHSLFNGISVVLSRYA